MDKELPQFEGYQTLKRLGKGAFGITYLCRPISEEPREPVTIKWLRSDAEAQGPGRFINEEWALQRLDHEGIPRFIDKREKDGRPYLVLSFAPGQPLREFVDADQKENGAFSELRTLLIAEQLLRIVDYANKCGIIHRDIKDDNVILTMSGGSVALIDWGMCKGPEQPEKGLTFNHGGASRFSPPAKLRNPSEANVSHEVFAIGVLSYLLLTARYPWEVEEHEDRGHLAMLMEQRGPSSVREHNNKVSSGTNSLIMKLLVREDHARPTIEEALAELADLRASLEKPDAQRARRRETGRVIYSEVLRDPLHGDILLTDYEMGIISTPEFQRLRRIKQLGFSNLAFHGAEHSRLSHVIGTVHVAETIMRRIEDRGAQPFAPEERRTVRLYALLHDIGHIPFGHTLEDELGLFARHDGNRERTIRMLDGKDSKLGQLLLASGEGRDVIDLIQEESVEDESSWVSEIVSSAVGADVIDYIDRDSFHCGLDHRVDTALFRRHTVSATPLDLDKRHLVARLFGRRGFRLDAELAMVSLWRERFALFLKVYTHEKKLAAGAMLGKAVYAAMQAEPEIFSEITIEPMGDEELLLALRASSNTLASRLGSDLLSRRLYKPAYRAKRLHPAQRDYVSYREVQAKQSESGICTPAGRDAKERQLAQMARIDAEQVAIYLPPSAPGAKRVGQYVQKADREHAILESEGPQQDLYRSHLGLWQIFVFGDPALDPSQRKRLVDAAQTVFHQGNELKL